MSATRSSVKPITTGEFLLDEHSQVFCRESGTVLNNEAGDTVADLDPVLQPVRLNAGVWDFATSAEVDAGTIEGVVVGGKPRNLDPIANGVATDAQYAILARGPFVWNDAITPEADAYGTAIDAANFKAAVGSLGGVVRVVSPTQDIQEE